MTANAIGNDVSVLEIDSGIVGFYPVFNLPADRVLLDELLAEKFTLQLASFMGLDKPLDIKIVKRRLITLRKLGRLPRLQRNYNGRNTKRVIKPR